MREIRAEDRHARSFRNRRDHMGLALAESSKQDDANPANCHFDAAFVHFNPVDGPDDFLPGLEIGRGLRS